MSAVRELRATETETEPPPRRPAAPEAFSPEHYVQLEMRVASLELQLAQVRDMLGKVTESRAASRAKVRQALRMVLAYWETEKI